MSIVHVENLRKTFQSYRRRDGIRGALLDLFHREYYPVHAVDGISFDLNEGELIGYIGPNGAGKSTSIKMLTGILKPSSGDLRVLGYHPFQQRREYTQQIGVVFGQRTQLWWDIAIKESFSLLAKIYRVPTAQYRENLEMLVSVLQLGDVLDTPARKLSLGQRMRCDIAASLIHGPRVLFLDEPTIGLDAVAKESIRNFLRHINRERRTTIVLTTHDLKEIEELCERIVVIDRGKILYDGSLQRVRSVPGLERTVTIDFPRETPVEELARLFGGRVQFTAESARRIHGRYLAQEIGTGDLLKTILSSFDVTDISASEPNIEEVIMKLYREGVTG